MDVTIVTAHSTNRMVRCNRIIAHKYTKETYKLISAICGYSGVSAKFSQCFTNVTKVTVHFQYAKFKKSNVTMLQCYSPSNG